MKRLICMAVLVFVFFQTNASTTPTETSFLAKTNLVSGKILNLSLANLQQSLTRIELTDLDQNETFYSESFKGNNGYSKNLNINNLKDGKYLLKIMNNDSAQKQVIKIKGNMVLISNFVF